MKPKRGRPVILSEPKYKTYVRLSAPIHRQLEELAMVNRRTVQQEIAIAVEQRLEHCKGLVVP